ncbi:hypothetical protein CANCADRAFT_98237 [Tortispora caseinolytica NRRL Y-17796]|uniref:N-glycosylase/DNA lyase n=1 Tax=Tortispora caseinolytica NRRL Y-17796 TaxID=767744 RepID=A0A1E4TDV5_9ASCO|nr:hypothetical protein CANCADRAFT_98237 [Tortispora caseinolytica NRRL Y-17796]
MWSAIKATPDDVLLQTVLRCGQSFRWKLVDDTWACSLRDRIVLLKQAPDAIHVRSIPDLLDTEDLVRSYLALDVQLPRLYTQWSQADAHLAKVAKKGFTGVRMLRQDPWETLCCFICSSNNNIKRITQMVDALCTNFGSYIDSYEGIKFYAFPTPNALAHPTVEAQLRQLGFGYRAKYIQKTAAAIAEHPRGVQHLWDLREKHSYKQAKEELLLFQGVGPKVADCVCLMGLDKPDAVPVDTHVWQIAQRDYKFSKGRNLKSLNKEVYDAIGDFFRDLWGPYAGWAHSVLFAADLPDLALQVSSVNTKAEVKVKMEEVQSSKKKRRLSETVIITSARKRKMVST